MLTRDTTIERFRIIRNDPPPPLEWIEMVGTSQHGWGKEGKDLLVAGTDGPHPTSTIVWAPRGSEGDAILEVRQVLPHGARCLTGSIDGFGVEDTRRLAEAVVHSISVDPALCPAGCHHRTGYVGMERDSGMPVICWKEWGSGSSRVGTGAIILCVPSRAILWPDGVASPIEDRFTEPISSIVLLPITRST